MLGGYEFKRYKFRSEEEYLLPEEVKFILSEGMDKQSFLHGIEKGQLYSRATILARDLVNEPASIATPQRLAEVAKDLSRSGRLKVNIYEEDAIREMGMGGLFAVSRGSEVPPRFVHILYEVPNPKKRVALVGKGITFDSGGLCIKSQESMQGMKGDMAGAAAVLGIASVLEELSPELNIHGIFPATENMPGGRAYKVGDILRILNGKTVEIVSTDAEGRLILADALSFASRQRPDVIIDIATLTGAIVVALGTDISGLFSDDEILVEKLLHASRFTGEKLWRMPVDSDYKELLKSEHADMKNSGGRDGGAILGALFLREFVEEGISWAHIDIAGAALSKGAFYKSPGATGVMVRTLLRYLESL
jgi:leucyl aminopeptidase